MSHQPAPSSLTLVTGATGYIGGELVPKLLAAGKPVRVFARSPAKLEDREWFDRVDLVAGDATQPADLARALDGVAVAYYLLHSMDGAGDFEQRDADLARAFARTAREASVRRIVYLSGLHPAGELSPHLRSRVQVGEILLGSGVPTAVLQAGLVLGDGSASFDMLRHLTERLPAMVGPRWLDSMIQPIALADALFYLERAGALPPEVNRTFDIGAPEAMTYRDLLRLYAEISGLMRPYIATVPVLTPRLASGWVGLVTPVPAGIARPLVGSLIHDAVVKEEDALDLLGVPPRGRTSVPRALESATAQLDPGAWRRVALGVGLATAACAVVGSVLTTPDSAWYRAQRKPPWQPPRLAFPVVWTALYGAIAVAATATIAELQEQDPDAAHEFRLAFGANLALNAGWSAVFFRAHRSGTAAVLAGLLGVSAADLARRSVGLGRLRAGVFAAYAAWCTFASSLAGGVAALNRKG